MPRLGEKYAFAAEEISRSRETHQSAEYQALGLPAAPAVMVENELAAQGPGISDASTSTWYRSPLPQPPQKGTFISSVPPSPSSTYCAHRGRATASQSSFFTLQDSAKAAGVKPATVKLDLGRGVGDN